MFEIAYHKLVLKDDFKSIPKSDVKKIVKTVNKKLSVDPIAFGKPLGGDLKNYYRLRIGFYRVIYSVEKRRVTVFVLKVGMRRDSKAYLEGAKRLGLIK